MAVGSDCVVCCCLKNFFLGTFNSQRASLLTRKESAVNNLSSFRHDCLLSSNVCDSVLSLFYVRQRFGLLQSLVNRLRDFRVRGHLLEKSLPIIYRLFIVLCLESCAAGEFQSL